MIQLFAWSHHPFMDATMSSFEVSAQQVSSRVNPEVARMDPALITLILTNVLPILLNCWQQRTSGSPAEMRQELAKSYKANPNTVLHNVAYQVRRQSRKHGHKLDRDQAKEMAQAIIDEAMQPQSESVMESMSQELDEAAEQVF